MSLEKSVLDIDRIRGILNSEYGLKLLDCISLETDHILMLGIFLYM